MWRPADITNAMAAGARKLGAEIYRRTQATAIERMANGEWAGQDRQGRHRVRACRQFGGLLLRPGRSWTGHNVPIANMLHHYMITEPLQELIDLDIELPVVRDPYSHAYLREETNGILVGPYETETAHVCWKRQATAWDFESELIAPELDRLTPWLERATERLPLFAKAGLKSVISGAITHTARWRLSFRPGAGPPNYWDALRGIDRHLPRGRRRKISRAVDGARPGRNQHA